MANADRWGPQPCSIEGCSEHRVSRGLCSLHYTRLRRIGDPLGPVRCYRGSTGPALLRPRRLCSVEGCDRRLWSRLCSLHYDRWRRQTDHKWMETLFGGT